MICLVSLQRSSNSHPSCIYNSQSTGWPFLLPPGDFLSLLSFQCRPSVGTLYFCLGFPFLSEQREHKQCRWCIWGTPSIQNKCCPGVLCGFCSLMWIKPGRCTVQPLLVVLPQSWPLSALGAWLRCLYLLQFDWDHCYSCGCSKGTKIADGKSMKVLFVHVEACLSIPIHSSLSPLHRVLS